MMLNRRNILALSGAGLAAGLIPAGRALAADINSLLLVEPIGGRELPDAAGALQFGLYGLSCAFWMSFTVIMPRSLNALSTTRTFSMRCLWKSPST